MDILQSFSFVWFWNDLKIRKLYYNFTFLVKYCFKSDKEKVIFTLTSVFSACPQPACFSFLPFKEHFSVTMTSHHFPTSSSVSILFSSFSLFLFSSSLSCWPLHSWLLRSGKAEVCISLHNRIFKRSLCLAVAHSLSLSLSLSLNVCKECTLGRPLSVQC